MEILGMPYETLMLIFSGFTCLMIGIVSFCEGIRVIIRGRYIISLALAFSGFILIFFGLMILFSVLS